MTTRTPLCTITGRTRELPAGDTLPTACLPVMVGDSGSGGSQGAVPAPAAGDAGKYLKGSGAYVNDVIQQGLHALTLPAGAFSPRISNGPSAGVVESSTNKVMAAYLAFDAASAEYAQVAFQLPKSWNAGAIKVALVWMHPAATTNFGVVWQVRAVALADGNALDTAFGAAVSVSDTGGNTNYVYVTGRSDDLTIGNTPAAEDWIVLQINRDPANGSDTLAVDACLLGVMVYYNVSAATDA